MKSLVPTLKSGTPKINLILSQALKGQVLIVGIGNLFRGDDGAGPALIKSLKSKIPANCQLFFMDVGEVPENFLGKMVKCKPDTVLFVDAVDFGASAGSVKLIDAEDLEEGSFSTHSSSLKLVIDYLKREIETEIFLLGIQAGSLKMGTGLSKPVAEAVERIEKEVIKCMS